MSTPTPDEDTDRVERVYVENDYYDGPRSGLADVDGSPHYFKALDYGQDDDLDGQFFVWPTDRQTLELERRQWQIFVAWNDLYETGGFSESDLVPQHPGNRGVNTEYDRLNDHLEPLRTPPPDSRVIHATWMPLGRAKRYTADGPNYQVRWEQSRARS